MPVNEYPLSGYYNENTAPDVPSRLYVQAEIPYANWDKYFPYQLKILVATKDANGTPSYKPTKYQYTLPIPPQELTVDMPIATTVTPTLTGIVEQHGGVPFRTISLQGTTGISPIKNRGATIKDNGELIGVANAIFGGTVQAVQGTVNAATAVYKGNSFEFNLNDKDLDRGMSNPDKIPAKSTGFYQYMLLERFLESYNNIKARGGKVEGIEGNPDAKDLRLAFCVWKEESVYLVSGVSLTRRRSVQSPLEYMYTLQLKAWARITLEGNEVKGYEFGLIARDPNIVSDVFNRFKSAREVIMGATNTINSAINDTMAVIDEGMRQVSLALKDMNRLKLTVMDLPDRIANDCWNQIKQDWNQIKDNYNELRTINIDSEAACWEQPHKASAGNGGRYYHNATKLDAQQLTADKSLQKALKQIDPMALNLPLSTLKQIDLEIERVRNYTRADFERIRSEFVQAMTQFADAIGAGDTDYHTIYDTSTHLVKSRTPSSEEWDVLFAMAEVAQTLDYLTASSLINKNTVSSIDYVAGLAEGAGIAFKKPRSKFAVPFPYGSSLEKLALQYLGDANRWGEIAVLNGLRSPYVDEEGFSVPLLTNGDRNQVVVSNDSRLHQGQAVWLSGRYLREKRHVLSAEAISADQLLLTLDGDSDLQKFKTIEEAKLEAFLPGTVNSQQVIYIPSDRTPSDDPQSREIPGVDAFDPLLGISGVDLLLTPDGDLAITADGDCRLAYGLTNIIQTIKIAVGTPKGALLQHPEFGFNIKIGTSIADVNPGAILKSLQSMFNNDPTFTGVKSASVEIKGNALYLTVVVGVAGISQYIPVTVRVAQ